MAASEISTSLFRDFSTSTYGNQGLNATDATDYTILTSGSGNGVKFQFSQAGWMLLYNSSGASITYTILLPEPAQYQTLGVTFTDKTITLGAGQIHLVSLDSRYKHDDGFIYVETNTSSAAHLQVVKRYTIS